jgi:hypothetical protein
MQHLMDLISGRHRERLQGWSAGGLGLCLLFWVTGGDGGDGFTHKWSEWGSKCTALGGPELAGLKRAISLS